MYRDNQAILNSIYSHYGYDFRDYSPELIDRRIQLCMNRENVANRKDFHDLLLSEKDVFAKLVNDFSINVSSMFRDPEVWSYLRHVVLPKLATYPRIRIWSAGTASGQEAYSLAIMLKELGLYEKSIIYATDLNPLSLEKAAAGRFALDRIADYSVQYREAGGTEDFSQYFSTRPHYAEMNEDLKRHIVFCTHSLDSDTVFNEFQLVLCRNVLIYFQNNLINKVLKLFSDSLATRGTLCLGSKESMFPYEAKKYFRQESFENRVYRRVF